MNTYRAPAGQPDIPDSIHGAKHIAWREGLQEPYRWVQRQLDSTEKSILDAVGEVMRQSDDQTKAEVESVRDELQERVQGMFRELSTAIADAQQQAVDKALEQMRVEHEQMRAEQEDYRALERKEIAEVFRQYQ
jgi:hypothetical protein